jgi:hypothetical protein
MRLLMTGLAPLLLLVACNSEAPGNNDQPANTGSIAVVEDEKQPTAPRADEPWVYDDALDAAVRWILDNQKRAGDWGTMEARPRDIYLGSLNSLHVWGNASSALCVMGLLLQPPTPEIDAALERALEYLIDAPDTPRAQMNTFYNVWAHTYMIQALTRGMADERFADKKNRLRQRAEHELRRLLDHQSLDGGWGYYDFRHRTIQPSGTLSTPFTTAAVLVAMHEALTANLRLARTEQTPDGESVRDHRSQIALDYVERHRIPNGAYYYSSGHMYYPQGEANLMRGSLARSQSGDNALITWNRTLTVDDIRAQLDEFFKDHQFLEIGRGRQFPHEAWYAVAPYYYYFGHYYAARNVEVLPPAIRPEYARKLADVTVAGQYDDGSFWDYPLYGYAKAYGTGYGVIILSKCKRSEQVRPTK